MPSDGHPHPPLRLRAANVALLAVRTAPQTVGLHASPAGRASRLANIWFAVIVVVTFVVPSSISFLSLKTYGELPVAVACVTILLVLVWRRGRDRLTGPRLITVSCAIIWIFVAFTVGHYRALTSIEASSSVRFTIPLLADCAVLVFVATTTPNAVCLHRRAALILYFAYFSAFIGLLQYYLHIDYASLFQSIPTASITVDPLINRDVTRATGTAIHPIEYAVVCAALLPQAIHHFRYARSGRRVTHGIGLLLIAFGAFSGVSRSGVIAILLATAPYVLRLSLKERLLGLGVVVVFLAGLRTVAHGLLSTLAYFFSHSASSQDPSVQGRTSDYAAVAPLIRSHPWFGIGLGTYQKDQYRILDNQYLGTWIETGYVGLTLLIFFFIAALLSTLRTARRHAGRAGDQLWAMGGTLLAVCISATFFDLFYFAQATLVLFITVGLSIAAQQWPAPTPNR